MPNFTHGSALLNPYDKILAPSKIHTRDLTHCQKHGVIFQGIAHKRLDGVDILTPEIEIKNVQSIKLSISFANAHARSRSKSGLKNHLLTRNPLA